MKTIYELLKAKSENLDYFLNAAVEPVLIPEKACFIIVFETSTIIIYLYNAIDITHTRWFISYDHIKMKLYKVMELDKIVHII